MVICQRGVRAEESCWARCAHDGASQRVFASRARVNRIRRCVRAGAACRANIAAGHASGTVCAGQASGVALASDNRALESSWAGSARSLTPRAESPARTDQFDCLVEMRAVLTRRAQSARSLQACRVRPGNTGSRRRRGGVTTRRTHRACSASHLLTHAVSTRGARHRIRATDSTRRPGRTCCAPGCFTDAVVARSAGRWRGADARA